MRRREVSEYCLVCGESSGSYTEPPSLEDWIGKEWDWVQDWRDEHVDAHPDEKVRFLTVEFGEQVDLAQTKFQDFEVGQLVTLPDIYEVPANRQFKITGFAAIGDQGFIAIFGDETNDPMSAYVSDLRAVEEVTTNA